MPEEGAAIRVAVVSDLHADEPDENGEVGSHLNSGVQESETRRHPISSLRELITNESLEAELLVCAGDITHRARPKPLQYAWPRLKSIAKDLRASRVIATVGNHDLDSRHRYNDYDARGMIQQVAPDLPVGEEDLVDKFWARHLVSVAHSELLVVILDTCAFHPERVEEREQGRISEYTVKHLTEHLDQLRDAGELQLGGILLCHHHLERLPQLDDEPDYDAAIRGPEIVQLLGSGKYGPWLVIHGHKHRPRVQTASGTTSAPVVFSAGSLAVNLPSSYQGHARNQFYILDLRIEKLRAGRMAGTGRAWDFTPGKGWEPSAGMSSGLPHTFGFGNTVPARELASRVAAAGSFPLDWAELCDSLPELELLLPGDFETLRNHMKQEHGLEIFEVAGVPRQVGRIP